jgi:hypothetical protein
VFGRWLRWVGGVPVDRRDPRGMVGDMVDRFHRARDADEFIWLALAPEGTRSYSDHWRSGFYRVALQAGVPLGLCVLRLRRAPRRHRQLHPQLSGDAAGGHGRHRAAPTAHRQGCRPELAAPDAAAPQRHAERPSQGGQAMKREDAVTQVRSWLLGLQQRIVDAVEAEDPGERFIRDDWTSSQPGERLQGDGVTRLVEGG